MKKRLFQSKNLIPILKAAEHRLMLVNGSRPSSTTMTRRHRYGVMSRSGKRRVFLDVIQLADGLYTDEQAIEEFVTALNDDVEAPPSIDSSRASDALKQLAAAGIA